MARPLLMYISANMANEKNTTNSAQDAGQTKLPNYRIYDRSGGGATEDIYIDPVVVTLDDEQMYYRGNAGYVLHEGRMVSAVDPADCLGLMPGDIDTEATRDAAIEAGREWIEDGDWSGDDEQRPGETIKLDCVVREIAYVPDLRSITGLPAVYDATITTAPISDRIGGPFVRVECGPDTVISMLPGKVVDASTVDEDGYYDVVMALAGPIPQMIDEAATRENHPHDCSGSYTRPAKQWSIGQVRAYIDSHEDDEQLDGDDLEAAFLGVMRRKADDDDREAGLWSLICANVG